MKKHVLALAFVGAALVAGGAEAQGYCREFSQGVNIGGQIQSSYGVACMQPDGAWQIVSSGGQGYGNRGYAPPPPMQPIYAPPPVAYYSPPPPIMNTGFSLSIGVPFHQGRGDCDDRGRWRKHHGHHEGWGGGGWKGHGGGHGDGHGWRRHHDD